MRRREEPTTREGRGHENILIWNVRSGVDRINICRTIFLKLQHSRGSEQGPRIYKPNTVGRSALQGLFAYPSSLGWQGLDDGRDLGGSSISGVVWTCFCQWAAFLQHTSSDKLQATCCPSLSNSQPF